MPAQWGVGGGRSHQRMCRGGRRDMRWCDRSPPGSCSHWTAGEQKCRLLAQAYWVESTVNLCFLVDVVLNFFTAVHDEETDAEIRDHRVIARRYLAFWFWIDVVSSVQARRRARPAAHCEQGRGGGRRSHQRVSRL